MPVLAGGGTVDVVDTVGVAAQWAPCSAYLYREKPREG